MKYLIGYLVIGIVITAVLLRPDEDDELQDYIHDAIVSIAGWPLFVILSIIDMFDRD